MRLSSPQAEDSDFAFLGLAVVATLALAFAVGAFASLSCFQHAYPDLRFEGGRGFAANFALMVGSVAVVLTGSVALVYLVFVVVRRVGAPWCWPRLAGYLLLCPHLLLFLRAAWVWSRG